MGSALLLNELPVLYDSPEQVAPEGTRVLLRSDERFPSRLNRLDRLWVRGDDSLLVDRPAFGLCGSRSASPRGIKWAEFFGDTVARFGGTLVTGMAKGVDQTATIAALQRGGTAIGVLAEGISSPPKRIFRDYVANGQLVLVSEFEPTTPWSVGAAMRRNETICRLGKAMFVIEAGTTGGTLAAGRTAIRIGVPLYAIAYPSDGQGNDLLIAEGGQPLRRTGDLVNVLQKF